MSLLAPQYKKPSSFRACGNARVIPDGGVILTTPTGAVRLSPNDGSRLLFHGAPVCVDSARLERCRRAVFIEIGERQYTLNARELGQVFNGTITRCLIYPGGAL